MFDRIEVLTPKRGIENKLLPLQAKMPELLRESRIPLHGIRRTSRGCPSGKRRLPPAVLQKLATFLRRTPFYFARTRSVNQMGVVLVSGELDANLDEVRSKAKRLADYVQVVRQTD